MRPKKKIVSSDSLATARRDIRHLGISRNGRTNLDGISNETEAQRKQKQKRNDAMVTKTPATANNFACTEEQNAFGSKEPDGDGLADAEITRGLICELNDEMREGDNSWSTLSCALRAASSCFAWFHR